MKFLLSGEWLRILHLKIKNTRQKRDCTFFARWDWGSTFPWIHVHLKFCPRSHCRLEQHKWSSFQEASVKMNIASAHYHRQICHLSLLTGIWKQGTICGWARTRWGHQVKQAWHPVLTEGYRGQCSKQVQPWGKFTLITAWPGWSIVSCSVSKLRI